jgi:hypothetical protein
MFQVRILCIQNSMEYKKKMDKFSSKCIVHIQH